MDNTPIFVKIDEYKDILGLVDDINDKMESIRSTLDELREIKEEEDEHIAKWNSQLDMVSEKMDYINETLQEM